MDFIPYSCQQVTEDDVAAVVRALQSDYLTQGPTVAAFEDAFALRHDVKHAVAVSNATAGLHIGCLALGVGPGSLVWTTPNSFLASANCAVYCGAQVDFVDIDPETRNLSLAQLGAKLKAARSEGKLPQVVIPVDFSGLPCDLQELRRLADEFGFRILEDASHAAGASYQGKPVGSCYADLTVFSFHAVKVITTAEGGLVTTQDDELAHALRLLRSHGMERDEAHMLGRSHGPWYYEQTLLGFNYRMTELQAALGLSQLQRIDRLHSARAEWAARYDQLLKGLPVKRPARLADRESAWHLYVVEIESAPGRPDRAKVFARMRAAGIGVNVHYIPIHLQPFYASRGFQPGDFPESEQYYAGALTLPLFPAMTSEQQDKVVHVLAEALEMR